MALSAQKSPSRRRSFVTISGLCWTTAKGRAFVPVRGCSLDNNKSGVANTKHTNWTVYPHPLRSSGVCGTKSVSFSPLIHVNYNYPTKIAYVLVMLSETTHAACQGIDPGSFLRQSAYIYVSGVLNETSDNGPKLVMAVSRFADCYLRSVPGLEWQGV